MPTIVLDEKLNLSRSKIIKDLDSKGIQLRPFFYPISSCPEFNSKVKIYSKQINLDEGCTGYYDNWY